MITLNFLQLSYVQSSCNRTYVAAQEEEADGLLARRPMPHGDGTATDTRIGTAEREREKSAGRFHSDGRRRTVGDLTLAANNTKCTKNQSTDILAVGRPYSHLWLRRQCIVTNGYFWLTVNRHLLEVDKFLANYL